MPIACRYSSAAAKPIASTNIGVPASNRSGASSHTTSSNPTSRATSPPVRNGGIAASNSARPYTTPMPVGPNTLWPENARKSQSSARTSSGSCGADWQASSTTTVPLARARATSGAGSVMVPSTFDTWAKLSSFTRGVSSASNACRSSVPSGNNGIRFTCKPRSCATIRQGRSLAWCSNSVIRSASPGCSVVRAYAKAMRFSPSVALRVNTISCGAALRKRATVARAAA